MMKHLKKLSALLVALAIFFTGIPASAFYEDEENVALTEVQETDYSSAENVDINVVEFSIGVSSEVVLATRGSKNNV